MNIGFRSTANVVDGRMVGSLSSTTGAVPIFPRADALALRLDATSITGIASGGGVPTWADKSGNNRDAVQATSGTQPAFISNAQNGLPVVRFSANRYFTFPTNAFTSLTEATMFIVVKVNSDPATSDLTSGLGVFGAATEGTHFPFSDGVIYDTFGTTVRKTTVNPTPSLALWNVYCVTTKSGSWVSYLNNAQLFSTSTNTVGFPSNAMLGRSTDGGSNIYSFIGDVGEFVIYSASFDATDRTTGFNFFKSKWATV